MPRVIRRLAALTVSRLKSRGRFSDGGGLYLQSSAAGTKSWLFRYMLNGRARQMVDLLPDFWTTEGWKILIYPDLVGGFSMKRSRFSEQQIAFILRQAEEGKTVEEVCRKAGISMATYYTRTTIGGTSMAG
jgi:hypothetical protein